MVTNITITRTTTFGGAFLVLVGLIGFVAPAFMGMHLSPLHNVVLLLSGGVAIYFGLKATTAAARTFCIVIGALYGLLGVAGFVALTIIPGALVLGAMDHLVHLILGGIFVSVGWGRQAATATATPRTR